MDARTNACRLDADTQWIYATYTMTYKVHVYGMTRSRWGGAALNALPVLHAPSQTATNSHSFPRLPHRVSAPNTPRYDAVSQPVAAMSATSAATHTAQPQPAQPHAARAAPPPSARHASTDAFLQATCTAWGHLQPADRKAVRASCRGGRLQHDRLLTHLQLTLGATRPQEAAGAGYSNNNITSSALGSPTADQIRASLQAVLARGARLGSLTICFTDDRDGRREAQM